MAFISNSLYLAENHKINVPQNVLLKVILKFLTLKPKSD